MPQRTDFDIKVVATVLDTVQELVGRYACLGDNQLYAVTLHNVWASYFNHDWYCTNRPSIDLDFPVPGNINVADILSATVSTSLSPRSAGVRPHDVRILFNGNQVGELLDQVPDGSYTFSVDPAFFNPSANPVQPVNQTLGLRTYHFNGGHYVVNTSSRLDLPLANYTRYVCAANPEEARDKAGQGFWPIPTQVDIQIVQPQAGALLELGWPVVLEATVDDGHESYIYYPVLARIVYSDSPQDVKTVMLVPYSSSGTVDTYRGYWLPARAGEVSITQTVYAGIVSGSDNVVVTVEPEATFSISGQVAWTESGNSISGVAIRPAQGSAPFGEVKTDEQGNYQIVDLPRGSYELTASREGYTFVDAANPNQSTIQVQISEMDASGKNFIAVYEAPQLPDRRFKGAGWLAYIDDTDPLGTGTNYWDTGIGWNVERIEDIGVGNPVPFERVNTFSENGVETIVRLDDPERHNHPPGQRGPFPSEGHGIDLNGSCDQIDEAWLARVDHIYTSTISADTGHMLKRFVLANEPNHHTDEWDFSVDEYTFVYNCYYDRWIEHELEPGRPGVRQGLHALYVAGPGHEPGGANSWETYYPGIFDNIPRADGFTMHVYGYYDGPDSEGDTVFNPWLDTFMAGMANWNQTRGKQKPLIITEYNPGAVCGDVNEPPGGDNNAGWDDWFRQTYCWVRAAQTTYPDAQLKGLIYFVDEPSQERGPDACWNPVSLRQPDNPESTRRQSWLNLNDSTCANARNQSQGFSGALCAPMSNVPIPTSQTKQMPSSSLNLPIGGAISGTLGEWGGDQVYYVTDDLEVAAGETLTIAAGTTLVFSPTTRLIVSGQLLADGNTVFPVRFTSTDQEVGHIWYDPLGGVIQNTLPATLTDKLAGHLDTVTGLQYDGARYYDPWVGSYVQPDPFGGLPQAPGSLNRFAFSVDDLAPISTSPGRTSYPRATATAVNLGFLAEARWWVQQGVSQGITYGTTQHLAEYSLIRLSVSASRHRLLTRLPERAIEVLGGRSVVESLPANRSLHTLSTGGIRFLRGQALERSAFGEFTENAGRWTGRVGDDYLSHSLSWMGSRWFGASLAGAGDLAIQWLWPGTGDAWNRDKYGLTPEQFIGRGAVAAGGGLLAWGTVELTTAVLVAGGVIAAPAEMPFIAGALIFVGVEFVYEWQIKPHLYEWLDLKGVNEP